MIPTTSIGTWCNFGDHYSTSVESTVADFMNGGPNDWRERMDESGATERIIADYRAAIDAVLPEGIALCGNEFIADIDADFDADEMTEAIEAIDLGEIIERHDIDRDEPMQETSDKTSDMVALPVLLDPDGDADNPDGYLYVRMPRA